ncbi:YebC/PmpR family DNA-binding transcriptional regulator [Candidatus Curtissbacteria bacterium]|nr:YebC/PmpR family DNA-binding transcriptional regulator [Candidatus Curtissbacteria bacterium]
MSGHSKWSQIKRQKGVADVKRGATFTKIAKAITIAVREGGGGDPVSNFKLRLVADQARTVNMPKENIQRAIDRGLGKGGEAAIEMVSYEGYAPGKVAIIIEAATDNKNRTTPEIKSMLEKIGGTFAAQGAVSWMFKDCGLIVVEKAGKTFDEIFEIGVEAGAEDVEDVEDSAEIYTKPTELESVKRVIEAKGLLVQSAELIKKPTTFTEVADHDLAQRVINTIERLEEHEDVQRVFSNFEPSATIDLSD